ncbi:RimK/LysX family protein [Microbulbifer thermotolerans]|uniref:RimK/LysX family protein n=1 Tax=Microbulbifer thermotolerans TaxID=252514 RepID=A0AB35HWV7_MICTH|nr:RimK/LysX family protein [Microbulbifer thermotolerans]MCX2801909.1 RimK/LysX family protein [Microbulbifer thermotolerans]
MRTFSLLCVLLATQLLAGCESLQFPWLGKPPETEPAEAAAVPAAEEALQCPEPVEVVCAEPEVKVVERVIERHFEKVVEVPVAKDKLVLGTVETVSIEPGGLSLDSVIDTGSSTSALNARDLTPFERDGKEWVRFKLIPSDSAEGDAPVTIELPVKRYMRVARPGFESQRRPVVEMNLTIGDVTHMVEVNLTDRGNSDFLLLIGRNFLKDAAVVDVSRRNVQGAPKVPVGK